MSSVYEDMIHEGMIHRSDAIKDAIATCAPPTSLQSSSLPSSPTVIALAGEASTSDPRIPPSVLRC